MSSNNNREATSASTVPATETTHGCLPSWCSGGHTEPTDGPRPIGARGAEGRGSWDGYFQGRNPDSTLLDIPGPLAGQESDGRYTHLARKDVTVATGSQASKSTKPPTSAALPRHIKDTMNSVPGPSDSQSSGPVGSESFRSLQPIPEARSGGQSGGGGTLPKHAR